MCALLRRGTNMDLMEGLSNIDVLMALLICFKIFLTRYDAYL